MLFLMLIKVIGAVIQSNDCAKFDSNVTTHTAVAPSLLHETLALLSPQFWYSRLLVCTIEALEHVVTACLVYLLVCLGIYYLVLLSKQNGQQTHLQRLRRFVSDARLPARLQERVLFVISHPDDECMFFGPLIYTLTKRNNKQIYLLCLSNGNYEQQSDLRRQELWRSCQKLGISSSNIILMNATNLPDDPNVDWKSDAVANLILNTVDSLGIQSIFTFDREGVSQHPNHSALYYAASSLCLANLLPKDCKFYTLDSINIMRKYLSIFDLLCTYCMSTHWCILSWQEAAIVRSAMKEHHSQMKWFRWLYICFSRYMFINSIREVNLSDIELEMQIHDH